MYVGVFRRRDCDLRMGTSVEVEVAGDRLGGAGTVAGSRGSIGADVVLGTCGAERSLLRLRFDGRYCIHLGYCPLIFLALSNSWGGGEGEGVGPTALTSLRQNLHRGGFVSAIPLESPVQAGGVSGACLPGRSISFPSSPK